MIGTSCGDGIRHRLIAQHQLLDCPALLYSRPQHNRRGPIDERGFGLPRFFEQRQVFKCSAVLKKLWRVPTQIKPKARVENIQPPHMLNREMGSEAIPQLGGAEKTQVEYVTRSVAPLELAFVAIAVEPQIPAPIAICGTQSAMPSEACNYSTSRP